MFLNQVATHYLAPVFEMLDPVTRQWGQTLNGRLDATDRFLSNYNRPTRKRMMYLDFAEDASAYDVARHKLTGEIYLLGVERRDQQLGSPTIQLLICHLATPGKSAGVATVQRSTVLGEGDDLGWVQMVDDGEAYIDLELRTTSVEPGSSESEIGRYYCFSEAQKDFFPGDRLELNGTPYVVDDAAYDSGFRMLRLTARDVHWVHTVFRWQGADRVYNRDTGQFDSTSYERNVSGLWVSDTDAYEGFATSVSDSSKFRVQKEHIGFTPTPGMKVTIASRERTVTTVGQEEYRGQWILGLK